MIYLKGNGVLMMNNIQRKKSIPHIYVKNNEISNVSDGFLELTGYEERDFVGLSLIDLGVLLKSEHQLSIQAIEDVARGYIYTHDLLPKEVAISVSALDSGVELYYFENLESPSLYFTLDNFGSAAANKNGSVAIFSYPEGILLQHDENYIDVLSSMNSNSDNVLGNHAEFPAAIMDVLSKGVSLHEFEVEAVGDGEMATYWDINIKMINGERDRQFTVISFYDVTERANMRKCSEKQHADVELVLGNMSDAINILDKDGNYVYVNNTGKDFLSRYLPLHSTNVQSVSSKVICEARELNDVNGERILFENTPEQRVLRGERLSNHKIIEMSEWPTTYYSCEGLPLYDKQGNIDGGILIYKDIELNHKVAEYQALRENMDVSPIFYMSFSPGDYKINYINQHTFQFLKKQRKNISTELDIIGRSLFYFYRVDNLQGVKNGIQTSIETKSPFVHKHQAMLGGVVKYTKTIFHPIYTCDNIVEKIVAIGFDISDEEIVKENMEKLLTMQEEIFINISHELKTPLSVIFSSAQLLNLYLENDSLEEYREEILNINKATIQNYYRLIKLVNNILDISKLESEVYELVTYNHNIVEIIDEIVESVSDYTKSQDIQLLFDPDVEEVIMALDVYKFDRILLNLISNAIKFSAIGKQILVKLAVTDHHTVRISVIDEGIGIEEKDLQEIFKKFIQLNQNFNRLSEGTGLGLPLAKSLAELHGGTLHVESVFGAGSTFIIELPIENSIHNGSVYELNSEMDRAERVRYEFSDIYF